jgi:uncharacterized protein YwgA
MNILRLVNMLSKTKFVMSKPQLIALLLYVQGPTGQIGEEIVGKTRLMKLVFLLLKEVGLEENISDDSSFEPYKYGPFDSEVYDSIDALKELHVLEENPVEKHETEEDEDEDECYDANTTFKLTDFGISKVKELVERAPKEVIDKFVKVKTIYGRMPLVELLHYVYSKYPDYARLSEAKI